MEWLLSSIWDDMEDSKREIVLRQVVDILLELASQRFDEIGILLRQVTLTPRMLILDQWYPIPTTMQPNRLFNKHFISAAGFWLALASTNLKTFHDTRFGAAQQDIPLWPCMVPALYDPSLDIEGFPLCPGDFYSQNIMIIDADTSPRISAVLFWHKEHPLSHNILFS